MEIEKIIYETTREIYSVEDKLRIATIFLFCYKWDAKKFAELLYTDNHINFIEGINTEFYDYEVDFSINLNDKNVNSAFTKTLEKVRLKYDDNGYYKALFNKDPYALVIDGIVNYDFSKTEFKKFQENLVGQLSLFEL